MSKRKDYQERILSGTRSKAVWRDINKLRDYSEPTHFAVYHLACKCQELEALLRDLQQRIGKLERQAKR